jgi:hypothetical protein
MSWTQISEDLSGRLGDRANLIVHALRHLPPPVVGFSEGRNAFILSWSRPVLYIYVPIENLSCLTILSAFVLETNVSPFLLGRLLAPLFPPSRYSRDSVV